MPRITPSDAARALRGLRSAKRSQASRENGKLGGRPKRIPYPFADIIPNLSRDQWRTTRRVQELCGLLITRVRATLVCMEEAGVVEHREKNAFSTWRLL